MNLTFAVFFVFTNCQPHNVVVTKRGEFTGLPGDLICQGEDYFTSAKRCLSGVADIQELGNSRFIGSSDGRMWNGMPVTFSFVFFPRAVISPRDGFCNITQKQGPMFDVTVQSYLTLLCQNPKYLEK